MNTLNIFPRELREAYVRYTELLGVEDSQRYHFKTLLISIFASIFVSVGIWIITRFNPLYILLIGFIGIFVFQAFFYFNLSLKAGARVSKMEAHFPDVLQLMASNLRGGITVDSSLVLAARPEFAPLDEEIKKTGKEIATGRDIGSALIRMAKRIGSDKIKKTIYLIISGLRAGGNLADLIEQTSRNMRTQEFNERKVVSSVLMYVIFIFFAVGVGAPLLFSLSALLVEILIILLGGLGGITASTEIALPLMMNSVKISVNFIVWFTVMFIIVTDIMASLVIGLIQKGEEKGGLKYLVPLLTVSLVIFFVVRLLLRGYFITNFLTNIG